jgi:hypothetical protein
MNNFIPSTRITDPAFREGRVVDAFAVPTFGMRPLFDGYSAYPFEATTPGCRRR